MREPCKHTSFQSCLKADECAECLRAENARLADALKSIADLSENSRAPYEAQIMKAIEIALGVLKP